MTGRIFVPSVERLQRRTDPKNTGLLCLRRAVNPVQLRLEIARRRARICTPEVGLQHVGTDAPFSRPRRMRMAQPIGGYPWI